MSYSPFPLREGGRGVRLQVGHIQPTGPSAAERQFWNAALSRRFGFQRSSRSERKSRKNKSGGKAPHSKSSPHDAKRLRGEKLTPLSETERGNRSIYLNRVLLDLRAVLKCVFWMRLRRILVALRRALLFCTCHSPVSVTVDCKKHRPDGESLLRLGRLVASINGFWAD